MNDSFEQDSYRGDPYDLVELQQLLTGPHRILFEGSSEYQDVLLIEIKNIKMYLNRRLEINSLGERIYYESLIHPGMTLARQQERVAVIGGDNGLALREILKYPGVEHVSVFPFSRHTMEAVINTPEIANLTEGSFSDTRVHIHKRTLPEFVQSEHIPYNIIILDLPQLCNEEASRYYTLETLQKLSKILCDNGIIICQAYSPVYAPIVFWTIHHTLKEAGFHTLSYHSDPWFGDSGFHIAGKKTLSWDNVKNITIPNHSLPNDLSPWFNISSQICSYQNQAVINSLDNLVLHHLFAPNEIEIRQNKDVTKSSDHVAAREANELKHILSGPHRILYDNHHGENHVLILETLDVRLYLDKQLQFSSVDEQIYHEALVHPALAIASKRNNILIVGGGDGLAIREILKYQDVEHIDLVDLDPLVLHVASHVPTVVSLNKAALHDKRVSVHQQDIQLFIKGKRNTYDVIIVDLPDPADEVLSRLYTVEMFKQLSSLLTKDGILICQSHSPEYAPLLFWSIGTTLKASGLHVLSYSVDVPSFGEWGFHLAGKQPLLMERINVTVPNSTLPKDLTPLFQFPLRMQEMIRQSKVNTIDNLTLHEFYPQE